MPEPIILEVKPEVTPPTPAPSEPAKPVSSPEVKVEEPKLEPVNVDKLQEQINNLNIALKQERESGKSNSEKAKELEEQLQKSNQVIEKLQGVFAPESDPALDKPEYLTKEEAEQLWQTKQEELKQMTFKEKQGEIIKNEVATLEKEWDGSGGKPKYLDEEVLKWQQENSKLYLTPVEAFNQMRKNEIIDWEVKQRLLGKKKVENVEQPGVSPDIHTPAEVYPKTDKELRDAIREVINSADVEL